MGRLSKRTLQCRQARRARDLKENLKPANRISGSLKGKLSSVINFDLLCEDSLLRYQHAYGLGLMPGRSREEMVWAVQTHFCCYQEVVDESSVLCGFIQALKRDSSSDSSVSSLS